MGYVTLATPMKRGIKLWLERAEYDWETASVMLKGGRYLYVAFMCQQTVEKILKGCIHHKTGQLPPYTHNLIKLTECLDLKFSEVQLDFLALLTRYYLNTRYPDYKQRLSSEISMTKAEEILSKSGEIFQWLKKELKI